MAMTQFKPPQHKHAHHLHSIPPREKTTRTLILDHMLWLHSRARFSQIHSELDRDDEEHEDEEEKRGKGVRVARTFKARAEGLEKVLCAMLDQPQEETAWDDDSSPTSLPNGVRVRIALTRLVNDLFASHHPDSPASDPIGDTSAVTAGNGPYVYLPAPPPIASYTPNLVTLSRVSSFAQQQQAHALPKLPSFHTFTATASGAGGGAPAHSLLPLPPVGSIFSSIPRGAGPESPWALGASRAGPSFSSPMSYPSSSSSMPPPPPPRLFRAVGRSKDMYYAGAQAVAIPNRPSTSRQQQPQPTKQQHQLITAHRCPHHLTHTCPPSSLCTHTLSAPHYNANATLKRTPRSNIGAGLSHAGPPLRGPRNVSGEYMTDIIPRFLKLSTLVAMELGKEWHAVGKEGEDVVVGWEAEPDLLPPKRLPTASAKKPSVSSGPAIARPSTAWYTLLADLLTRAALQGYLVQGWRGTDAVEVLLGVGVGGKPPTLAEAQDAAEDEEEEFEPDEMPGLGEAWYVLFGAGAGSGKEKGRSGDAAAYAEYEKMMADRISEVAFTWQPGKKKHC